MDGLFLGGIAYCSLTSRNFLYDQKKRRVRVWRKSRERFRRDCTLPTFKSGRKIVNIWGPFSFFGRTPLYQVAGKLKEENYLEFANSTMFPALCAYSAACTTLYSKKTIVTLIRPQL